jgi:gliding motility-associated-like protein
LVLVPEYENVTACNLNCKAWDGTTGGILTLEVKQKLTLTGTLSANDAGFRGGVAEDANTGLNHLIEYYYPANPNQSAAKGECIATVPNDKIFGRGRAANSGGGGNAHNAGGGGGGNGGQGGSGGLEYYNTPSAPTMGTNGLGGLSIFSNDLQKIVLGGSGGAGHMNDLVGSSGGNGGGIILIKAGMIESVGGKIIANGGNVLGGSENNDGQGGGGAGGTIAIECPEITGSIACELRGGRGGDCLFHALSQIIGPGGGGGGGKLMLSNNFSNIASNLQGGIQGKANQNLFNGAETGKNGVTLTGLLLPQDTIPATATVQILAMITPPICSDLFSGAFEILNDHAIGYSLNGGVFQNEPIFENLQPGNYNIAVRLENGCIVDTSIFIAAPSPLAGAFIEVIEISCKSLGSVVTSPGSGKRPFSYTINSSDWQADSIFRNLNVGIYTLTVQDDEGCSGTATFEIQPYTPLQIQLNSIKKITCSDPFGIISISASGGASPFLFSLGNQTQNSGIFDGLGAGVFQAVVSDRDTCTAQLDGLILETDTTSTSTLETLDICQQTSFTLPDGQIVNQQGKYLVNLQRSNGCDSTLIYEVAVLPTNYFIPNVFLPDEDGKNDYFTVFANPACFKALKVFRIFDRWGELLFEKYDLPINDEIKGWDGQFRSLPMPAAVYAYYFELEQNDLSLLKKSGNVSLVR